MPNIIIRGGPTHRPYKQKLEHLSKDELHRKRKQLGAELKEGLFSKDKMEQRDCQDKDHEEKRVNDYVRWKETSVRGQTNEQKMENWGKINKEFKRRGLEGKPQCMDFIRQRKNVRYD